MLCSWFSISLPLYAAIVALGLFPALSLWIMWMLKERVNSRWAYACEQDHFILFLWTFSDNCGFGWFHAWKIQILLFSWFWPYGRKFRRWKHRNQCWADDFPHLSLINTFSVITSLERPLRRLPTVLPSLRWCWQAFPLLLEQLTAFVQTDKPHLFDRNWTSVCSICESFAILLLQL